MNRFKLWTAAYGETVQAGRDRIGFDYTDEAYTLFPRYNVAEAVLAGVEGLDSDRLPDFAELQRRLVEIAKTASSDFSEFPESPIAQDAATQEREALALSFARAEPSELDAVEPLFYRRTLAPKEVGVWREKIGQAWGASDSYWYPLAPKSHPSLVALELEAIDADLQARLRQFFAEKGISRLVELREYGASVMVAAEVVDLSYNGAEGFWTAGDSDWIVYCSHEGTMTLGGDIALEIAPEYPASHYTPGQPWSWEAPRH